MGRRAVLERIVDERVGQTLEVSVSVAIDRLAEEIAKEAMADPAFRRGIREMVHRRSEAFLKKMFGDGARPERRRTPSAQRRSRRRS